MRGKGLEYMFGNEDVAGMGLTLFSVVVTGLVLSSLFNSMMSGEMDLSWLACFLKTLGL